MSENEQEIQTARNVNVPLEWHVPSNLPSPYASNVLVQAGEYEFILSPQENFVCAGNNKIMAAFLESEPQYENLYRRLAEL